MAAALASDEDTYLILEVDWNRSSVKKNLEKHQYVIGDCHHLPLRDESFDVILLFEVLEHLQNPFEAVAQCARCLQPGGTLVVSAPQYWHVHGWPHDYFRYTEEGLHQLARCADLEVMESWPMGGPCVLIWHVVELNFSTVLRLPILRQVLAFPALLLARLVDWIVFSNNTERRNPDTKGWMLVARKGCCANRLQEMKRKARLGTG